MSLRLRPRHVELLQVTAIALLVIAFLIFSLVVRRAEGAPATPHCPDCRQHEIVSVLQPIKPQTWLDTGGNGHTLAAWRCPRCGWQRSEYRHDMKHLTAPIVTNREFATRAPGERKPR